MSRFLAGFDVGGTDVKFGIVDSDWNLVCKDNFPTPRGDPDRLIEAMCAKFESNRTVYPFTKIGIGCAGYVNPQTGIVTDADNLDMKEIRFKEKLEQRLGLPVKVNNDVQAALIAEHLLGAGQGRHDIIYLTLGTGVGGAFLLDGSYYRGRDNGGAEIGHMIIHAGGRICCCGMRGCFEQYASISALVREMKRAYSKAGRVEESEQMNGKLAFAALRQADPLAWKIYRLFLKDLCIGLISLMNLFAPELIIIGGALSNEGEYFAGHINATLEKFQTYSKYFSHKKIELASLGNDAGIIGAALL